MAIRAGILTISDKGARGERVDTSGAAIVELLSSIDATVQRSDVIPDERGRIAATMRAWADSDEVDVIITTGGTGLGPRDVTPEATAEVIERPVPGLGELMRAAGLKHTPMAALSRGVAGVRGRCLIINLPGSEKGVRQNLSAVIDLLPHAVELLRGRIGDHSAPSSPRA
ncbi:MAG: MogA/MoaB family molybdenum cofactor biosynthesis protein [Dehalococcoidia bacterium]|nr:MogA/MoaB family molybdenum cofactor biosynthesis protein [Dehalococcoidia bacterium]